MITVNKLYGKNFNQYNEEDWKYIFSIYTLRDRYNHTEEEFLAAELVDKVIMMKKMDEKLYHTYTINIDELKTPLVSSCSENSCEAITAFLNDEDVKDINHSGGIPDCNPKVGCKGIQDFLEESGVDKFYIFRITQTECYDEIYQCQNRIEECKKKIRAEIQDIKVYRQKLEEAFNQYIE